MRRRRLFDPADAVVWCSAILLAVLCGIGAGFALWSFLQRVDGPPALRLAVYIAAALAFALSLRRRPQLRLFVGIAAAALLVSFSLGSALWGPLVG